MSQKFSSEEDERLIDLVREHPALYQVKSRSYKDAITKNNSWRIIAEEIGRTEDDCKGRWKSIRDYYQRKRKEYIKGTITGSQRDDNNDNFPQKFKHLQFLENSPIVERRSTNSIDKRYKEEEDSVDSENIEEEHYTEELPGTSEMHEPETQQDQTNRKRPRTSSESLINEIRKDREERTTFLQEVLRKAQFESDETDPATFMFFKSVAITVSAFPPILKARAKAEIMNVISRYEIEALSDEPTTAIAEQRAPPLYTHS